MSAFPWHKQHIGQRLGNKYLSTYVSMRMSLLGRPDEQVKAKVRPLTDARAIEIGANFISEIFLL